MRTRSASSNASPMPFHQRPMAFTWLLGTLVLAVLPHIPRLPLWIALSVFGLCLYRFLHDYRHWRLPSRWLNILFALVAVAGILSNFGMATGRRAAIAFLIVLLGLKLLETRTQRDTMVLSCIGFFLVITNFVYSQSIFMVAYLLLVVWLLTISLMHFQHLGDIDRARLRVNLRQGSLLFAQSLPLMIVLFILFPRIDGPLWGLPEDEGVGLTGFSDQLSPGQITDLSRSSAVAFRVEFDGKTPPTEQQYWRGLVLWEYDGITWRQGPTFSSDPIHWQYRGESYTYSITLEPHNRSWLFSLDLPHAFKHNNRLVTFGRSMHYRGLGTLTNDFQLRAWRPVSNLKRYTLQSVPQYRTGALAAPMRRHALRLPDQLHPRVRQLAQAWAQSHEQDRDIVQQALDYFRQEPFVYTLTPPALHTDPTYEFLFETRRGYCEHFASSFTVLMRAAGIPARVVVGYQGSEANPLGNYLTVRQSNAHAWSEVWLHGQGWVRVDPTAAVAPDRIEMGLDGLPDWSPTPLLIRNSTWLNRFWRTTRLSWDALHHYWNHWVLQYSAARQTQLMAQVGLGDLTWQGLTALLTILLSLMLGFVAFCLFRQQTRRDRVVVAYQTFCAKLARRHLPRKAHEGPLAFAQRVKQERPELETQVDLISSLYTGLRYGRQRPDADLKRLQYAVRAFRP